MDVIVDFVYFFFFQAEDGIRDLTVTGVQTCALPILFSMRSLALAAMRAISLMPSWVNSSVAPSAAHRAAYCLVRAFSGSVMRSEEHTSELQSQSNLVCRLLLEKKKTATRSLTTRSRC